MVRSKVQGRTSNCVAQHDMLMVNVPFLPPALSSELVAHLLVRDQLRTKQDAMLLDVQDLT